MVARSPTANITGKPRQTPNKCGIPRRTPKLRPVVVSMTLLGPGVSAAIMAKMTNETKSSSSIADSGYVLMIVDD